MPDDETGEHSLAEWNDHLKAYGWGFGAARAAVREDLVKGQGNGDVDKHLARLGKRKIRIPTRTARHRLLLGRRGILLVRRGPPRGNDNACIHE